VAEHGEEKHNVAYSLRKKKTAHTDEQLALRENWFSIVWKLNPDSDV